MGFLGWALEHGPAESEDAGTAVPSPDRSRQSDSVWRGCSRPGDGVCPQSSLSISAGSGGEAKGNTRSLDWLRRATAPPSSLGMTGLCANLRGSTLSGGGRPLFAELIEGRDQVGGDRGGFPGFDLPALEHVEELAIAEDGDRWRGRRISGEVG